MKYAIVEMRRQAVQSRRRVATIEVDLLPVEAGQPVELEMVLLVADGEKVEVGTPVVAGARVLATIHGACEG